MINTIKSIHKNYYLLLYILLIALYGYVGFTSPGYDDEYWNINLAQTYGFESLKIIQTHDVHPPASYLIDCLLYQLTGNWHLVRLIISIFSVLVIIKTISFIKKEFGAMPFLISFFLIGLNPSVLMWTTGLRWYAFFTPILLWTFLLPKKQDGRYWLKCFASLLILGYLGYATFLIALPVILFYWLNCNQNKTDKIRDFICYGLIALLSYTPQLIVFIKYHLPNQQSQKSGILSNLIGLYSAQFSNQGVFPVSFFGILSGIGVIGIFIIYIFEKYKNRGSLNRIKNNYFNSYILAVLLFFITGIGGKFRNYVVLSPLQGLWISTFYSQTKFKKIVLLLVTLIISGNFIGVLNVVTHNNTTKNSWNLPIEDLDNYFYKEIADCSNNILVASFDPLLTNYLHTEKGLNVISPYLLKTEKQPILSKKYKCVFIIQTFQGSLTNDQLNALYKPLDNIIYQNRKVSGIGFDKFGHIKRFQQPNYPDVPIKIIKFTGDIDPSPLINWKRDETLSIL